MTAGRLAPAIADAIVASDEFVTDQGVIVTEYLVLAAFVESDGTRCFYTDAADDQTCTQSLGLLAFATALETKRVGEPT